MTLRAPKWGDLDDMLHFINSLVEEKAMILMNEMQTRDSEITWISTLHSNVEKDKMVAVVAEIEGKFAGSCEISRRGVTHLTLAFSASTYWQNTEMPASGKR